jgi:hypothetical protein
MMLQTVTTEFEKLKIDLIKAYDAKGMRASGKFADGLLVEVTENSSGFKAVLSGDSYAQQLETGRKSGKQPPIETIKQWIQDKGVFTAILQSISISSLAFLIARKIGREGWKREQHGGVNLISEVVTDERIQRIINEVGAVEAMRLTTEIIGFLNELEVA